MPGPKGRKNLEALAAGEWKMFFHALKTMSCLQEH